LILVVVAASLAVLYESGFLTGSTEPEESEPSVLWQIDLEHFATDFAVADGKVFTADHDGIVYCFDAQSGKSLWNASIGGYSNNGLSLEVYDDKLYVGCRGSVVNRVDMDTGEVELSYQAPVWTSWAHKWSPSFFVADGKVFAEQNGLAVYNEDTGELFWKSNMMGPLEYGNISAPESDYIFIRVQWRVNPNNGSIIWSIPGSSDGATEVTQGKVLFWNYNPVGSPDEAKDLLCVNASSGEEVWRFYVGSRMFQPIVSNDMVLFGAEDGYLYAVDFEDGTLDWKTPADDQNTAESDVLDVSAFSVQADSQHKRVFWSVTVSYSETGPENGTMLSLDLSDGDRLWTYPVINETSWNFVGATLSNNILYVTENHNLYCLDTNNGTIKLQQNFEHYTLPPIAADDKVFVAADLWLIAYK
jgi:outer membrane protein assembly factor BamB